MQLRTLCPPTAAMVIVAKPRCNSSALTPLDPPFSPVIKDEEETEEEEEEETLTTTAIAADPDPPRLCTAPQHSLECPGTSRPLRAHGH